MIVRVCAFCNFVKENDTVYSCAFKKEIGIREVFILSCDKFITKEEFNKRIRDSLQNAFNYIDDALDEIRRYNLFGLESQLESVQCAIEEQLGAIYGQRNT